MLLKTRAILVVVVGTVLGLSLSFSGGFLADRPTAEEHDRAMEQALLDRIEEGRQRYGIWNVDDGREYPAETLDEVIDALHYCAAGLVRLRRRGKR